MKDLLFKKISLEKLIIFFVGISLPLITLRINLNFYTISLFLISITLLIIYSFILRKNTDKLFISTDEIPILLFLIFAIISSFYSVNKGLAAERIFKFIIAIIIYFLIKSIFISNKDFSRRILKFSFISLSFYILFLIYVYIVKYNLNYIGIEIAKPSRAGKNSLALIICIFLPFAIVSILRIKNISYKNILIFLSGITIILGALLLQTRALYLIFIFYIFILFIINYKNKKSNLVC